MNSGLNCIHSTQVHSIIDGDHAINTRFRNRNDRRTTKQPVTWP